MKLRHKLWALLLAVLMATSLLPIVAMAETEPDPAQSVTAQWKNFRNSDVNMAITTAPTPKDAATADLRWAKTLGTGWSAAPSVQIIVDDALIVMSSNILYKLDLEDGSILSQADMSAESSYGFTPVTFAEKESFLITPLGGGILEAFDAKTLEKKWTFTDELGGQALAPVTYSDGKLYTGFWNGETKDANFICADAKTGALLWKYKVTGGFYWAGSAAIGDYIVVGTDDGISESGGDSRLLCFKKTYGETETVAPVSNLALTGCGDQRSSIAVADGRVFFTTKNGYICSAAFNETDGTLSDLKTNKISNQSTTTPVVYGDCVYICAGSSADMGSSAGNFVIADKNTLEVKNHVGLLAYPQSSPLLSTAYLQDDGLLYFYSTYNGMPGGITMLTVEPDDPSTLQLTELYDAKDYEQYCLQSIICDVDGNLYYKNDSCNVLSVGTHAASPTGISVNVTIANQGSVVMAQKDIEVIDRNADGKFNVDEVLYAAHDAAFEGGAAAGYSTSETQYGLGITKLWGNSCGSYGYWLNNNSCWSLSDEIQAGDHLTAFVYADASGWSDIYTAFDSETATVTAGTPSDVILNQYAWDDEVFSYTASGCAGAQIEAFDTEMNPLAGGFTATDKGDGKYAIQFEAEGTYFIAATKENNAIVPALCKVTVKKASATNNIVNVTIANQGSVVMAQKDIEVTDRNADGKFDVDEVLYAAHDAAFEGGAAAGYSTSETQYGLGITKLWGNSCGSYGYWLNNNSCWSLSDEVQAGDHLTAFVYADASGWSDIYTAFDSETVTVTAGTPSEVILNQYAWDDEVFSYTASGCAGAQIEAFDTEMNPLAGGFTATDKGDGKYAIRFKTEGTYFIVATKENNAIVPALCKITVERASGSSDTPATINVSFRLIGAEKAKQDVDLSKDSYLPAYVTWIATKSYTLNSGSTVYTLFVKALADAGLAQSGAEQDYVRTITAPASLGGYTIGEFDNGVYSGWMYTINGTHPGYGLKERILSDGDAVIWRYVNDSRHECADWNGEKEWPSLGDGTYYSGWLNAADVNPSSNDSSMPIADGVNTAKLSGKEVQAAAEKGEGATLETGNGSVKLDADALKAAAEAGKDITVQIDKNEDGSVTVKVTSGGEPVNANVKVELPATEDGQVLVIIHEDGTEEVVKKSLAAGNGKVYAEIPAGATVKLIDNKKEFSDVAADDWFAKAVDFASSHELFNGVSDTEFAPEAPMTRAMLATVLFRLENAEATGENPFADVLAGIWYTDAVIWANEVGIITGTGIGFEPDANVTREQTATMLYRYMKYLGVDVSAKGDLSAYPDGNDVSDWAQEAMAWAVQAGVFQGDENGALNPLGNATRAEVATLIARVVELIVK